MMVSNAIPLRRSRAVHSAVHSPRCSDCPAPDARHSARPSALNAGNDCSQAPLAAVDWKLHPVGIIIMSQDPPGGIRFEMSRDHWAGDPATWHSLQERVVGKIIRLLPNGRESGQLNIDWESDGTNSNEYLSQLLKKPYGLTLLPYGQEHRHRSAPKAKGSQAKAAWRVAMSTGPYAPEPESEDEQSIEVPYTEGGVEYVQIWNVRSPTFVKEDWRPGDRFRAKILLTAAKYSTTEKMLFNVALITPFASEMAGWANERLQVKGQLKLGEEEGGATWQEDGKTDWNRPTTRGEIVRFWGYMVGIALYPSVPVEEMWRRKPQPGDLFSPPDVGRHGMTKNRFKKLRQLHAMMFSADELDLNENDKWRYCRAPVSAFNDRRRRLIVPSWLLSGDELMSMWLGEEGVQAGVGSDFRPIPHRSYVERKPEPLGCEMKVVADGNIGAFLSLEVSEGAECHELQDFFEEYGHNTAVSIRMLQSWFKTPHRRPGQPWYMGPEQPTRAYYGDSFFMGVNAAEAIHVESGNVIYPFGDVKTMTARFPVDDLLAACGPNSGDWATFTTEVPLPDGSELDMMGIAHRRGPEVHLYVSTHGVTTLGEPQKHKDDECDVDTGITLARKSPKVLNDATTAQPKIDRGNRRRQFDLEMERRFRTEAFPFRCFTTILGVCMSDLFYLDVYFNKSQRTFRETCSVAAWAMMYNRLDDIDANACSSTDLYWKPAQRSLDENPFAASPARGTSTCGHIAVPLHCIPGYTGDKQQDCAECGLKCSYCCILCSTKDFVVPLHQPFSSVGKMTGWRCAQAHRANPAKHAEKGVRPRGSKITQQKLVKSRGVEGLRSPAQQEESETED